MEQNERITVNIGEYKGEKPIEIILREGAAPRVQQLELKAPESIDVSGVLETPYAWLEKRVDTIDQKEANIVVDREAMTITLTVDERDSYKKAIIKGSTKLTDVYAAFGINDSSKGWIPSKLGNFLRLNRSLFSDKTECMQLVSLLKNFSAKVKAEIQKSKDPSGSMAEIYRQEVESNLPQSFVVNVAIFVGTAKTAIEVEFDHYLKDNEVYLQLVSPGAKEVADNYRDACIDVVLEKINAIAPNIVIIEA